MTEFSDLGLSPATLKAVAETGYTTATPIQGEAIPVALQGLDVLGIAQTGTGKTAAFTLPMIDRLAAGRSKARMPRALVIAPTRELADQVAASFEKYAKGQKLSWALLIGGVSFSDQEQKLDRGVDVLIATPGRLLDHFERGKLLMTGVQIMVVDEADRMLDMGFIPDLERIFKLTPAKKQTLFFSATMPPEITRLTKQFLRDPVRIEASRPATTAETITQNLVRIPTADPKAKRTALRELIARADVKNGIVFCNRKSEVDIVAKSLKKHGLDAAPIHGDLDQSTRMRTLESFRSGELRLLCASDVAARGLDIPAVSHVFNYDVPHHADDYVHRIGRTGRAGRLGQAFMIVTPADSRNLDKVLKLIGKVPDEIVLEGIDWSSIKDEPRTGGRGRGERDRGPGRGRERGGRDRDRTPREERPRRSEPAEAEIVASAPAPEAEEAPARPRRERAPREERPQRAERGESSARSERPERAERPERTERPEREARPERSERPDRERRPERRRDRDDNDRDQVVGFGNDTPAFLMRAAPIRPSEE
ncbi:MAG: RNA helicase [Phenylobacterium sp. RIFCSPHIGHO2_01_FULL_69_31]|uniref:DEAD/DEAH box helicase n=1 Tax=Phenylobacterium sp. RIFCSPHIGHO2_01_FULL_69_31 TaxID=1801944 RepID=UPI0008BEDA8B|nr:DEAD/DEAH box helicase [Phenylobacterium sp. RIFCSPHIGHO2_01_FULL_69_31]OHB27133.1 MAG: RNA helicase [Phenylobacterium sp. RIFCSPHIGHO2_01_FULL_69_31]